MSKVQKPAKTVLFREGDKAEKLYMVKKGEILCLKNSKDRIIPVFYASEGDVVGESAIVENLVYTYSAISMTEVDLVEIPHGNFKQVMQNSPGWLLDLTTTMIQRFQNTANLIAENRVIHPLILMEDKFPSTLEVELKKLLNQ